MALVLAADDAADGVGQELRAALGGAQTVRQLYGARNYRGATSTILWLDKLQPLGADTAGGS